MGWNLPDLGCNAYCVFYTEYDGWECDKGRYNHAIIREERIYIFVHSSGMKSD